MTMTAEVYKQCCDPGVTWEGTTHGKVRRHETHLCKSCERQQSMREWRIAAPHTDVERSSVWTEVGLRAQSIAHFWQTTWPSMCESTLKRNSRRKGFTRQGSILCATGIRSPRGFHLAKANNKITMVLYIPSWLLCSSVPAYPSGETCGLAACVQVGKIGGLDAYFAEPKSTPKAGVMLIHDIHGWDKKNVRLVADKYADAGIPLIYHLSERPHLCPCPVNLVASGQGSDTL